MVNWIQVGTDECPTQGIAKIIKSSEDFHFFHEKWPSFAEDLGINQTIVKKLKQDLLLGKIQLTEVVRETIEVWVGDKSSGATLETLLSALEANELNSIADLLTNEVYLKSSNLAVPSYYIRRTLITRNVLNKDKFLAEVNLTEDIFVFSGIRISKLTNILKRQIVAHSTRIIQEESMHRFIILDHSSHFEKICKKADYPVHWIKAEDKWIHIKSNANLSVIRSLADKKQSDMSEDKLIEMITSESNHPVCISDSPGMGKSTLLQNIGKELSKRRNIVLLTTVSNFLANFEVNANMDKKSAIEITLRKLFCKNPSQNASLSSKFNSNTLQIELLLDGLDEANSFQMSSVLDLLQYMSGLPSLRIWVTTRPHLLHQVEDRLNIFGHNIAPLSKQDQIIFLKRFWFSSSKNANLEPNKLEKFANRCLFELNSKLSKKDEDIAGIPLQCLLIGEVYEEQAQEHCSILNANKSGIIQITSLVNLYEKLIDKQFDKYSNSKREEKLTKDELFSQHVKMAFQLIFPELVKELPVSFQQPIVLNELLSVGLLEKSSTLTQPKFFHRTIGEYFIADVLKKSIPSGQSCMNKLWSKIVFPCEKIDLDLSTLSLKKSANSYQFVNSEICHFLNTFLTNCNSGSEFKVPLNFNEISQACMYGDFFYIFKLLTFSLGPDRDSILQSAFTEDFLFLTIRYSTLPFVKTIFDCKINSFDTNLQQICLLLSIKSGNLAIFQYLINEKNLRNLVFNYKAYPGIYLAIHECVFNSLNDSNDIIKQKMEILRILIEINSALLEEKDEYLATPILCSCIHPKLITKLVSKVNILAKDTYQFTILHANPTQLDTLFQLIPIKELKWLVQQKTSNGNTPLMTLIKGEEKPNDEIIEKCKELNADFNCEGKDGYSLLALSIIYGCKPETLRKLISCGGNVNWKKGWKRKSLIHYAGEFGRVDLMLCLAQEFKMSLTRKDWSLNSPMDYLCFEGGSDLSNETLTSLINFFVENQVNFNSKAKQVLLMDSLEYQNDFAVEFLLKNGTAFVKKKGKHFSEETVLSVLIVNFKAGPGTKILTSFVNSGLIKYSGNVLTAKCKMFSETTLLHIALLSENQEFLKVLIEDYAHDVNVTNKRGQTPLQQLVICI